MNFWWAPITQFSVNKAMIIHTFFCFNCLLNECLIRLCLVALYIFWQTQSVTTSINFCYSSWHDSFQSRILICTLQKCHLHFIMICKQFPESKLKPYLSTQLNLSKKLYMTLLNFLFFNTALCMHLKQNIWEALYKGLTGRRLGLNPSFMTIAF